MIDHWRKDRDLAGAKLIELWTKGNFDQPLYLIYVNLGDYDFSYHIVTSSDFNNFHWNDAKFITAIGV